VYEGTQSTTALSTLLYLGVPGAPFIAEWQCTACNLQNPACSMLGWAAVLFKPQLPSAPNPGSYSSVCIWAVPPITTLFGVRQDGAPANAPDIRPNRCIAWGTHAAGICCLDNTRQQKLHVPLERLYELCWCKRAFMQPPTWLHQVQCHVPGTPVAMQ